jgi:class 3 adenylate cyclase
MAERLLPYGGTREDVERLARWIRASVTSEVAQKLIELRQNRADLRHLLAKVSVPTLVIHRRGDHVPFAGGIELASKIPEARFLPLEGYNHLPATHDEAMELVTPVVEFLAGGKKASVAPSEEIAVPITSLFMEIKGSASLTRRLGADGVQRLIQAHRETARGAIESYNGKELNAVGSAIVASFFSPSRAVGCALHINQVIAELNAANPENSVRVRIGLNASEPIAGDHGFVSLAQLAGQVYEEAKPGQVLVSDVVRQLAAGKGFTFEHLGVKRIKGFDGPVALYKVSDSRTIVSGRRPTP